MSAPRKRTSKPRTAKLQVDKLRVLNVMMQGTDSLESAISGLEQAARAARHALDTVEPDTLRERATDLAAESLRVAHLALSLRTAATQLELAAQLLEGGDS
jgi:hypothetical protein